MIEPRLTKKGVKRFRVRVPDGKGGWDTVGTFPKRGRIDGDPQTDAAAAEAKALLAPPIRKALARDHVDRYLAWYRDNHKPSSYTAALYSLRRFKEGFGNRELHKITEDEAEDWARDNRWAVPAVVTMLNRAVKKQNLHRNPFDGLGKKGPGRKNMDPLTIEQVELLADSAFMAHADLGDRTTGRMMRALILFCAYTGVREGEAFDLEWHNVDLDHRRAQIRTARYAGRSQTPKSGKRRPVFLPPQARDALVEWGVRPDGTVFPAKRGGKLSTSSLYSTYWPPVLTRFRAKHPDEKVEPKMLNFHGLRHFAGWFLWVKMDLSDKAVATTLGHSNVRQLHDLYGHFKVGALDEMDRAFADVTTLRAVPGESHGGRNA